MTEITLRGLRWIASSRRDMRDLPAAVRRAFGLALFAAQSGETPSNAKPLKGFGGASVLELIEDGRSGTYRAIYTVRFAEAIYVLHVFQNKSKQGRATPLADILIVNARLKQAIDIHADLERGIRQ